MKRRLTALVLCIVIAVFTSVRIPVAKVAALNDGIPYAESMDEAAALLREACKKRDDCFTVRLELPELLNYTSGSDEYKAVISDAYHAIYEKASEHTGEPDEGDYIYWQIGEYGSKNISALNAVVTLPYEIDYYDNAGQEQAVADEAANIIASLGLSGKTDYEKVCAIYDYICSTVTYDYSTDGGMLKHSAYASFILHTSVCQGYTLEMYRLMLAAGIDCRIISGFSDAGAGHGWNIVKLGRKYYFADATWDAGSANYGFFLKGTEDFEGHGEYKPDMRSAAIIESVRLSNKKYDPNEPAFGDTNADGRINSDDAIYVIYHVFFPTEYPVADDCDFDKNGTTDANDAIYLLYHVYFPEMFPID